MKQTIDDQQVTPDRPVSFRPGEPLATRLQVRHNSSGMGARRDLLRYYQLLEHELERTDLDLSEAQDIVTAAKDWAIDETGMMRYYGLLWAPPNPGKALIHKLQSFTPGQTIAVLDAVERFWRMSEHEELAYRLRAVGLLRKLD